MLVNIKINILFKVQKDITQWDPISFTVEYKILYKNTYKFLSQLKQLNYPIVIGIFIYFYIIFLFHSKRNGIPLSNIFLYVKQNVLYWPDDDRLRSKHVATVYLNINQLDALNFMSLFLASICFEHMCSSSGGQNCTIQPLVSSH